MLGQLHRAQQSSALLPEQVGGLEREQVASEDGVDLVAKGAALAHERGPVGHPPAKRLGLCVRHPDLSHEVRGSELGETFASTLSVLTFAWAIALVCIGLDIVILPACSASRSTIAHETDVDSSTTWSVGSSAAAKARRSLVSNRPTRRT